MQIHEYAALFPPATDAELRDMAADIKARGLINPIITLDGKVLDGRNRLLACDMVGETPRFTPYTGTDALGDVVSWNLKRRHLAASQLAELGRALKPMFEEQARERMRQRKGDQPGATVANLPHLAKAKSRDQAAAAVGVSGRTVQDAEYVHEHAPELSEEIKAGRMTVHAAKQEVKQRERKTDPLDGTRDVVIEHDDKDSTALFHLKRYWRQARKKDRQSFLEWIDHGGGA